MTSESPRLQAVIQNVRRLMEIAEAYGAYRMSLCGSVARGADHDADEAQGIPESDIDFYAWDFQHDENAEQRACDLVIAYCDLLQPFAVDVRAYPSFPGYFLDDHDRYRTGAIDLSTLETG